ncbi:unnamed protein product [Mytilus edulis]|uniref:Endonuclease/exonuclease/phosphatase domain-containing protein n=1 Tax=Mytilus edulis TaxID=6550 RepID=A0A8S3UGG4_MYTED|nr:unnamed protein product [Mytilus edulis]
MSSLKLLAWNVRGIMSSTVCLSNLLRSTDCDVCIISEHKLKTRSLNYLSSIEQGYNCVCKADSLPNFYNAYHGKGGIAILYKSTLQFSINEIHDTNSERIVGLEIKTPSKGSLFIFGAYLPSDESVDNYRTELNILDALYTHYSNYGNVIIAGDLNASCLEKDKLCSNKYKSAELIKFVKRYQLLFSGGKIKHKGPDYTFINKTSMIDYILMNDSIYRQLKSYEILSEGSVSSTSDHLPILAEIVLQHNPHKILNSFSKLPAWHKITDDQIELYKQFLHEPLQILIKKMDSDNADIDTLYNDMVTILHAAADKTVPKCSFNPFTKPYWTSGVKIAHEKERTLRKAWVIDGRPRGMHYDSYKLYKRAKHEFRNIQQAAYEQYIQQTNDDINKAAECDIRLFWKLIKRNKAVSSKIYPEIIQDDNICNTPESIANAFMDYFSKLYQPDSDEMYDNDTRQQIELDYNKILKSCYEQNVYLPGGIIKESEVDGIIKLLKRRKASGHDKIQHEHLLYGGHTLVRCLTSLFNLVVSKGRIPNGWKLGLLVPLFKGNNKPKTSPDSYRPITLLPCVLKVNFKDVYVHACCNCPSTNAQREVWWDILSDNFPVQLYCELNMYDDEILFQMLLGRKPLTIFSSIDESVQFLKLCHAHVIQCVAEYSRSLRQCY